MEVRFADDKWTAVVWLSPPRIEMPGFIHCQAHVEAKTNDDALSGAQYVLNLFAQGRKTFVRVPPEANRETNFDTKEDRIQGYVRFSFSLEPGEWFGPEPSAELPFGVVGLPTVGGTDASA
jgi:hypothetical protein